MPQIRDEFIGELVRYSAINNVSKEWLKVVVECMAESGDGNCTSRVRVRNVALGSIPS